MYKINEEELSIYVTRGDSVFFNVGAKDEEGNPYTFVVGDHVRIKVYKKKNASVVVLEKSFHVTAPTDSVQIYLSGSDTKKISEVISKPVTYWYEVELNPDTDPHTIIGYDDVNGAKIFMLFPEGADKEVEEHVPDDEEILSRYMDDKLDPDSTHPVENRVIWRAITRLEAKNAETENAVTPKMYGAVGDGETDDTNAFENAIKNAKKIRIPEGRYKITKDLVIDQNEVSITGHGAVLVMNGHDIIVGGTSSTDLRNEFSISGVELSGGSLKVKCLNTFTVDNCYIHNATYGIVGSHCYNGNVVNSKFTDCEYGVLFDKDVLAPSETADHNMIKVMNCRFYNNTNTAFVIRGGFVGEFSGNSVEGNAKGIVISGMADFKVMTNYFEYNDAEVITLENLVIERGEDAIPNVVLDSSIQIGGNRIHGSRTISETSIGLAMSGTVMGLLLLPNSWGGYLWKLIKNDAALSGPVLLYQVNNTSKSFPTFVNNMCPLNQSIVINSFSTQPQDIVTGRMYTYKNAVYAQTEIGGAVRDYKIGHVPRMYTKPSSTSSEPLIYYYNGDLYYSYMGTDKKIQLVD